MAAWSLPAAFAPASLVPWLGRLATVVMLAILAWLGTNIFWTLTAKDALSSPVVPSMAMETDPRRAAQTLVSRHIFGELPSSAAAAAAPTDIRLTGVIAALKPGQLAMAFLALDGKPAVAVREGEEVGPGITLRSVQPRQVELLRGGQVQILTLPEPKPSSPQSSISLPQAGNPSLPQNRRFPRRRSPSNEPDES